jgi:hypothetical protein
MHDYECMSDERNNMREWMNGDQSSLLSTAVAVAVVIADATGLALLKQHKKTWSNVEMFVMM